VTCTYVVIITLKPNETDHVAQNNYLCSLRHIIMMHLGNGDIENAVVQKLEFNITDAYIILYSRKQR